jgi:hypothetical protein
MRKLAVIGGLVLAGGLAAISAAPVRAAQVTSTGTIVRLVSYSNYGNGDVVVFVSSTHSTCSAGYWVSPSQPGYKTILAHLMLVKSTGESVIFWADNALLWPGSSGSYCRIESIG